MSNGGGWNLLGTTASVLCLVLLGFLLYQFREANARLDGALAPKSPIEVKSSSPIKVSIMATVRTTVTFSASGQQPRTYVYEAASAEAIDTQVAADKEYLAGVWGTHVNNITVTYS